MPFVEGIAALVVFVTTVIAAFAMLGAAIEGAERLVERRRRKLAKARLS